MKRYPAHIAGDLISPRLPSPLRGGQSKRMDDILRMWPGLFKIMTVSLIIMAIVLAWNVAHANHMHHVTKQAAP